jgi:biopolymer transport protein ExbB
MKRFMMTASILCVLLVGVANAQDIREAARRAKADKTAAEQLALETEQRILNDRAALTAEVERLEQQQKDLEATLVRLEKEERDGTTRLGQLEEDWSVSELEFREISGNVRLAARDLLALLEQSPLTGLRPERLDDITHILRRGYFPDIDDITAMVDLAFEEAAMSGQVALHQAPFIGRDGAETIGTVLTLGRFTSVYEVGDEVGFLRYASDSHQYFALSTLPGGSTGRTLKSYLAGENESMIVDMSGGAALRQVMHQQGFVDQLRAGGPLVWPIGLIALVALGLILYKIWFLNKVGKTTGTHMQKVNELAGRGEWSECEALVERHKGEHSPVNHVIDAGLRSRHEDRETLDSVLTEAILRELPRLERGLSTLGIFGAVAPLLGLLGTVTGMIDTFRVITLFGTGDPKLMSGGISEALITTEIGLAIAIPIMLLHTFLSRRVDGIIGDMEEKAVALSNIIHKERARHARDILDDTVAGS